MTGNMNLTVEPIYIRFSWSENKREFSESKNITLRRLKRIVIAKCFPKTQGILEFLILSFDQKIYHYKSYKRLS